MIYVYTCIHEHTSKTDWEQVRQDMSLTQLSNEIKAILIFDTIFANYYAKMYSGALKALKTPHPGYFLTCFNSPWEMNVS